MIRMLGAARANIYRTDAGGSITIKADSSGKFVVSSASKSISEAFSRSCAKVAP